MPLSAPSYSKPEVTLSKTQPRYKVSYVRVRRENRRNITKTYYSSHPSLHLKGNWLAEAGFETVRGVTVRISEGCIVLMAEGNEVQELRE
ncbi:type I toxin-antitoxin system SymE family toxin [Citrobacter sp. BDA59-3]|nr:type I toxin-antitoxin system SymE family toxin [Citrobacter sp. BDA59-3]